MGQGPQQVYVDGVGLVSIEEARRIQQEVLGQGASIPQPTPGFGPFMPTPSEPNPGEQPIETGIFGAIPEIAGLAAQFHPATRALRGLPGVVTRMLFPAGADAATQAVTKGPENVNLMESVGRGVLNAVPEGIGKVVSGTGSYGRKLVTEAVTSGGPARTTVTGAKIKPTPFTQPRLDRLTNTALAEGAQLNTPAIDALIKRAVDLENRGQALLQTDPRAARALLDQAAKIEELVPHLRQAQAAGSKQASGPARFLSGAGVGAMLAVPAGATMGLDYGTSATIGAILGLPVGISQASTPAKLAIGRQLEKLTRAGMPLEAALRAVFAGTAAQ